MLCLSPFRLAVARTTALAYNAGEGESRGQGREDLEPVAGLAKHGIGQVVEAASR